MSESLNQATVWLVYWPTGDYEVDQRSIMVCPDQATANAVAEKFNSCLTSLRQRIDSLRLLSLPLAERKNPLQQQIYRAQLAEMFATEAWPYGINFEYEVMSLREKVCVMAVDFRRFA